MSNTLVLNMKSITLIFCQISHICLPNMHMYTVKNLRLSLLAFQCFVKFRLKQHTLHACIIALEYYGCTGVHIWQRSPCPRCSGTLPSHHYHCYDHYHNHNHQQKHSPSSSCTNNCEIRITVTCVKYKSHYGTVRPPLSKHLYVTSKCLDKCINEVHSSIYWILLNYSNRTYTDWQNALIEQSLLLFGARVRIIKVLLHICWPTSIFNTSVSKC